MSDTIEWMLIKERFSSKKIGCVGFIGDEPTVVLGFYEDYDANKDGTVSRTEWVVGKLAPVSLVGTNTLEVIARAREQATLMIADGASQARASNLSRMFASNFRSVAVGMALDGIFKAYIAPGLSMSGGAIGTHIGAGAVKTFMIKKGMEKAAKAAFDKAVKER